MKQGLGQVFSFSTKFLVGYCTLVAGRGRATGRTGGRRPSRRCRRRRRPSNRSGSHGTICSHQPAGDGRPSIILPRYPHYHHKLVVICRNELQAASRHAPLHGGAAAPSRGTTHAGRTHSGGSVSAEAAVTGGAQPGRPAVTGQVAGRC